MAGFNSNFSTFVCLNDPGQFLSGFGVFFGCDVAIEVDTSLRFGIARQFIDLCFLETVYDLTSFDLNDDRFSRFDVYGSLSKRRGKITEIADRGSYLIKFFRKLFFLDIFDLQPWQGLKEADIEPGIGFQLVYQQILRRILMSELIVESPDLNFTERWMIVFFETAVILRSIFFCPLQDSGKSLKFLFRIFAFLVFPVKWHAGFR